LKGVQMDNLSRRKLLASAGAATGAAAIAAAPTAAAAALDRAEVTDPSGPPPHEPVIAYVRDVKRGEVTVMSGTRETTYRDPALVKRLVKAAPGGSASSKE
jgi:phosphodiesterase/alkaline phosphatase D-like protein